MTLRLQKKNNLFLTIKGKNNNGTSYISEALKKGVKYIVSSQKIKKHKSKLIKVDNEKKFLTTLLIKKLF